MTYYIYANGTCLKRCTSERHGRAVKEAAKLSAELGVECCVSTTAPSQRPLFEQATPVSEAEAHVTA